MQNSIYDNNRTLEEAEHLAADLKKKDNENCFYLKKDFPLLKDKFVTKDKETIFVLSEEEKTLEKRMDEARQVYRQNDTTFIAAKPFYSVKADIASSKLFEVFKSMPKGGLLHVHSSAALSSEGLCNLLKVWDEAHQSSADETKRVGNSIFVLPEEYSPQGEGEKKIPSFSLFYWKQVLEISKTYHDIKEKFLPVAGFLTDETWKKLCTMISFCDDRTEKCDCVWDELNLMFIRIDSLFSDKDFYREFHIAFFKECINDNISYVEMRSGFTKFTDMSLASDESIGTDSLVFLHPDYSTERHFYFKEILMNTDYENPVFLDVLLEALDAVKKENTFNLKVILNVRRDLDPQNEEDDKKIAERLDYAIRYRNGMKGFEKYKDFVIGFDFVSEEDRGRPTREYLKYIYGNFQSDTDFGTARIKLIDFFLHDGESCYSFNDNIIYASIVSKYRIGHGFNMAAHSGMINSVPYINRSPCTQTMYPFLEICPISNQLLRYFPDLRVHCAYSLMQNGVQCVLGNDDPLMFGNPGLSYDFWLSYVGMGLDFRSIKRLVYNALAAQNYGAEKPDEAFDKKWDRFVDDANNILK